MTVSMTALSSRTGGADGIAWTIELRSVNAKGLDIRMRLPDALAAQEPNLRSRMQKKLARGAVSVSVRTEMGEEATTLTLDKAAMQVAIEAARTVEAAAQETGLTLQAANATDFLKLPGLLRRSDLGEKNFPLKPFMADFEEALAQFGEMRAKEGEALAGVLTRQVEAIDGLIAQAKVAAEARKPKAEQSFRDALQRILDFTDQVEEGRVAQELAVLATKSDVTEELDRLDAHVAGARALLAEDAPIGRRLDFLMQEFNREANTLCSKSGDGDLTTIGLDLKATIEQMREQVQNVE